MTSREIIEAALALPEADRVHLIAELHAITPEPARVDDVPPETVAIVHERMARARAGEPGLPGEEVFEELLRL